MKEDSKNKFKDWMTLQNFNVINSVRTLGLEWFVAETWLAAWETQQKAIDKLEAENKELHRELHLLLESVESSNWVED